MLAHSTRSRDASFSAIRRFSGLHNLTTLYRKEKFERTNYKSESNIVVLREKNTQLVGVFSDWHMKASKQFKTQPATPQQTYTSSK